MVKSLSMLTNWIKLKHLVFKEDYIGINHLLWLMISEQFQFNVYFSGNIKWDPESLFYAIVVYESNGTWC